MAKKACFGVFRVFLVINFLVAPNISEIGHFCSKSGSFVKIFGALGEGAETNQIIGMARIDGKSRVL